MKPSSSCVRGPFTTINIGASTLRHGPLEAAEHVSTKALITLGVAESFRVVESPIIAVNPEMIVSPIAPKAGPSGGSMHPRTLRMTAAPEPKRYLLNSLVGAGPSAPLSVVVPSSSVDRLHTYIVNDLDYQQAKLSDQGTALRGRSRQTSSPQDLPIHNRTSRSSAAFSVKTRQTFCRSSKGIILFSPLWPPQQYHELGTASTVSDEVTSLSLPPLIPSPVNSLRNSFKSVESDDQSHASLDIRTDSIPGNRRNILSNTTVQFECDRKTACNSVDNPVWSSTIPPSTRFCRHTSNGETAETNPMMDGIHKVPLRLPPKFFLEDPSRWPSQPSRQLSPSDKHHCTVRSAFGPHSDRAHLSNGYHQRSRKAVFSSASRSVGTDLQLRTESPSTIPPSERQVSASPVRMKRVLQWATMPRPK